MTGLLKPFERWGRRNLSGFLRVMLAGRRPTSVLPEDPSSVLVVRTDSRLGNLVLLEPLLRSLSERFPGCSVQLLASDAFSAVLSRHASLARIWAAPKKSFISGPHRLLAFFRSLRREGFDVAVDASHPGGFSLSGAVAVTLSGARHRIGWSNPGSRGWFDSLVELPPGSGRDLHESAVLHHLGSLWSGWPAWSRPSLAPPRHRDPRSRRPLIGLHVGARRDKGYPVERMSELAGLLRKLGEVRLLWGTQRERELAVSLSARESLPRAPGLEELSRELSSLDLYITPDNGTMHLASALGIPVIGLFAVEGSSIRFAPLSPGSVGLYARGGPEPEEVAARARAILGGP
ncbi:glycosyltransferase family 9 protein [Candidatus Fermentibacterales bacterium]|nr:glycosyltransferase family 9 protein [Candidatus Fermentibacterales bacterium]